jgi:hypothetical protein
MLDASLCYGGENALEKNDDIDSGQTPNYNLGKDENADE